MIKEGYYILKKDFYNFPCGTIFKAVITDYTDYNPQPIIPMIGNRFVEFVIILCKRKELSHALNLVYVSGPDLDNFESFLDPISEDEVMIADIIL